MAIRSRHQRFAIDRNHMTVILRSGARQPSVVPLLDSQDSSSGIFCRFEYQPTFYRISRKGDITNAH
jgi:hypothetical protein